MTAPSPPSLLVSMVDQISADPFSPQSPVQLPNLDRLAASATASTKRPTPTA
ncbi:MAG: hypothetical protein AAF823_00955 [Planctomycetota bacterium]